MNQQPNNPLHNVTLSQMLEYLIANQGWAYMADQVNINCFKTDPSIASSLKFLRKTPWARARVETVYVYLINKKQSGLP